jgi:tRNA(Ile)-lysidine synthetase-like protein
MLLSFIKEWLENPDWWFCPKHSFDAYINDKFCSILDTHDLEILEEAEKRALCIAYDQLPRHMFRGQPGNHIIQYYLRKALDIFNSLESLDDVHGHELCFLLLPLRHTNEPHNIFKAVEIVWGRCLNDDGAHECIYKKFLKASYERCPVVGGGSWDFINLTKYPSSILDYEGSTDIYEPFVLKHAIVQMFLKHIRIDSRYIISLSGGVDSMVGAYIAAHTLGKDRCCYVHINYNNRDTSHDEEMFVRYWSAKWGIRLYVRRFSEIQRPLCMKYDMREVYETYTRNVRYACYRDALPGDTKVILLHNKDDCFENILTNITQKGKYENLLGMTHSSVQDGICFYRPFLNIPKAKLIEYALTIGIPYLYDSTPKWSQRGQIRDHIVPVLSTWNTGCIPAFFELSSHVSGLHAIVDDYVDMILRDVVVRGNGVIEVEVRGIKELPRDITVWRKILTKLNLPQPSTKSIEMFIQRGPGSKAHLSKELDIEFSNGLVVFKKSISSPSQ